MPNQCQVQQTFIRLDQDRQQYLQCLDVAPHCVHLWSHNHLAPPDEMNQIPEKTCAQASLSVTAGALCCPRWELQARGRALKVYGRRETSGEAGSPWQHVAVSFCLTQHHLNIQTHQGILAPRSSEKSTKPPDSSFCRNLLQHVWDHSQHQNLFLGLSCITGMKKGRKKEENLHNAPISELLDLIIHNISGSHIEIQHCNMPLLE